MSETVIPIFSTHHSVGQSILTSEKEKDIKNNSPVSVLAIAEKHKMAQLVVVDSDIGGFWKLYKSSTATQLIYGIKMTICADMSDKTPEAEKTESSVIVAFRNSQAYYDFVPIYSDASTIGNRAGRRLDWKYLGSRWTDNFDLWMPFYSSFIARNTMRLDQKCFPDFGAIKPTFLIEDHSLPFDSLLKQAALKYAVANNYRNQDSHQIYYYRNADVIKHQALMCLGRRATLDKPNLDHYGSDQFSYESYLHKIGANLE